jgi:hypothetical protein
MNTKTGRSVPATYRITIETPFGVVLYKYTLLPAPHGKLRASIVLLDAAPRLAGGQADDFIALLPDLLLGVGEAAIIDSGLLGRRFGSRPF